MPTDIQDVFTGERHADPAMALPPDGQHDRPAADHATEKPPVYAGQAVHEQAIYEVHEVSQGTEPTADEIATLRRVPDKVPLGVYSIAFVELVERFSYYGTTVVCESSPSGNANRCNGAMFADA